MILDNLLLKAFVESRLHIINITFIFRYYTLLIHDKNVELYLYENA
jgi:hypothetical protein